MAKVIAHELTVASRSARVYLGGEGEPLLLLHGAWGGAAMHWEAVWERLAERHLVIAPDLPGLAAGAPPGPVRFSDFARYAEAVLDAAKVTRPALVVGNSFGAAVAWRLAAQAPARCRGLVLVDGGPFGAPPAWLGALLTRTPLRRVLKALWRQGAFGRGTIARAFADPRRAPAELREAVDHPAPPQLDVILGAALGSETTTPAPPTCPIVLLWGEDDRLLGSSVAMARRLAVRLSGSRLVTIPRAGHCPQIEQPESFVTILDGL
jgi:pimeloyl-ACP methyl ester carboxylesterase